MKIKICGLRLPANIQAISPLQPDMIGLIFYPASPRYAGALDPGSLPPGPARTGVFVNAPPAEVLATAARYRLDYLQLHGQESPGECASLRGYLPVIKAFPVDESFDFDTLQPYLSCVDYFLLDARGPAPGGNGIRFDWNLLAHYTGTVPLILSGGIRPGDAAAIRAISHPALAGIDLNSGFEISPGEKSLPLLARFIGEIRGTAFTQPLPALHPDPDPAGYYGEFGGAFIPEMLYPNVEALRRAYRDILDEPDFQAELTQLLRDYAGRATPLYEARRLSARYGVRIFLKREDLLHTGAHKLNNTLGQILLAERLGKKRIIAETGAGQHGVATATVCALRGLQCVVYMGAVDMERQAPNVARMRMLGAEVIPARSGSQTLKDATNEALRDWIAHPEDTHYCIGSVVGPHPYPDMVARFQSVISAEMQAQLRAFTGTEDPDAVIACVGGGSNAAGAFYHYIPRTGVALVMAEAAGLGLDSGKSAATSFLGSPGILHGSHSLVMQTADGQIVEPHSISAGLDYPGMGPLHAHLLHTGRAHSLAITDAEALEAACELARLEGIIPALESAHALACLARMDLRPGSTLILNLSGRGDKDLAAYTRHMTHGNA